MLTIRMLRGEERGARRLRLLGQTSDDLGQLVDFFGQVLRVSVARSRNVVVDSRLRLILFRVFFRGFLFHRR